MRRLYVLNSVAYRLNEVPIIQRYQRLASDLTAMGIQEKVEVPIDVAPPHTGQGKIRK